MKQENVDIVVGSKFDAKGFKQAETAVSKLNKTIKSAAGALGLSYGTRAVTQFGIAAVKAFSEDEAAAVRLSTAVDNLGISFANPEIAAFISNLEKTAMVSDDVLRPAYQGLLTTTGSLIQSQKLLNDAITISRGTNVDLATVSQDLANGYIGITKGLKKYNSGLTTAEISSMSFSEVLGVLLKQSSGAANAYLDTTSFKFDTLTIATDNAREMIGEGLVAALARASGGTEASDTIKTMNNIAKAINAVTFAGGGAIGVLPNLFTNLKNLPSDIVKGFAGAAGAKRGISTSPKEIKPKTEITKTAREKALEKLEKDAAKRAKELAALAKKQTDDLKKKLALEKAGSIFDVEQAGVLAALKGKITNEERTRLELQLAILTGNSAEASKLAYQLAKSQGLTEQLAALLASLPKAKNPFESWASYLDMIEAQARRIAGMTPVAPMSIAGNNTSGTFSPAVQEMISGGNVSARAGANGNVNVYVAGSVVSEADLVEAVRTGLLSNSLSGSPSAIGRLKGSFAG